MYLCLGSVPRLIVLLFLFCVLCVHLPTRVRACVLSVSIYHEPHGLAYPSIPHLAVSSSGARISSTPAPGHPISFFFLRCRSSETREGKKKTNKPRVASPLCFSYFILFSNVAIPPWALNVICKNLSKLLRGLGELNEIENLYVKRGLQNVLCSL